MARRKRGGGHVYRDAAPGWPGGGGGGSSQGGCSWILYSSETSVGISFRAMHPGSSPALPALLFQCLPTFLMAGGRTDSAGNKAEMTMIFY